MAHNMPKIENDTCRAALQWYMQRREQQQPSTYRKVVNRVYDPECGEAMRRKVKHGQHEYNLQRSSRFCNYCVNCAEILELASGLYMHNYREINVQYAVSRTRQQQTEARCIKEAIRTLKSLVPDSRQPGPVRPPAPDFTTI
ncbi:MAG: hypothetical protein SGPRY_000898 [Prymnesium sp.]